MAPATLLGPPELRNPTPQPAKPEAAKPAVDVADPFMNLMVNDFNKAEVVATATPPPPMGFTENGSATFISTSNPCLDLFFHVVPNSPAESVKERLQAAWDHDPSMTLKLICNLRGVRGTGKSDKEGFYTAAFWLHSHHPKTLACNVASFAEFGYVKDLMEIIYRILEGPEVRKNQKAEWRQKKRDGGRRRRRMEEPDTDNDDDHQETENEDHDQEKDKEDQENINENTEKKRRGKKGNKRLKSDDESAETKQKRISEAIERSKMEKEKASELRKAKKVATAKKVLDKYSHDPEFRFLYERVSDYFAECLKKDLESYNAKEFTKVSLAAKWCPSIDSSYDIATLICESIARKMFPRESYPEYEGIEEAHYAYRVRDRLRKQVLVPLKKCLELPEIFIGANRWDLLPYNRVASVAMKFYKEKFLKHDKERFNKYLENVKTGKAKIAAGALLPHEIIKSLNDEDDGGQVAELQWKRMVDDLLKKGRLSNCLAVCDVSGSMHGVPMEVSVALGVLVSELSEDPWKGRLITFSEDPKLQMVEGDDLKSKTQFVREMDWGMNTDFQKVFDLILQVAVDGNLKPEHMIKRLFVFSDMEFDQASLNPWETDYQAIVRKYTEKGFGSAVPQIVFWNLRDSRATPVPATQKGVALMSGFSKNLLNLFLDNDGEVNPVLAMEAAIAGEEYQKLAVMD